MGTTWSNEVELGKGLRWPMSPLLALLLTALSRNTASAAKMSLHSTAFAHEGAIPKRYTCQGDDLSPPLNWRDVPSGAKSLVLIVDDPDAPDPRAPKITWVHWVLYNLPAESGGLPAAVKLKDLSAGTEEALNSWGRTGYGGPCPPIGRHRMAASVRLESSIPLATRARAIGARDYVFLSHITKAFACAAARSSSIKGKARWKRLITGSPSSLSAGCSDF